MPDAAPDPASPLPALITGASSGIGADLARVFARHGHPLALVARTASRLEALADEIHHDNAVAGAPRPIVIAQDLAAPHSAATLAQALEQHDFTPGILVNNAGYGLIGPVSAQVPANTSGQLGMIDLNIHALAALTLRFLPQITARRGAILNVASTAGFFPGPGMAVYYASKAFVLSFSQALSQELAGDGVRVSALCPGPTATEFFLRAGAAGSGLSNMAMMSSGQVAEAGYRGLMAGKRVIVPGLANKILTSFGPLVPTALLLRLIARLQLSRSAPP